MASAICGGIQGTRSRRELGAAAAASIDGCPISISRSGGAVRFEPVMSQLDLPKNELEGLGPFGFTRTLDEAIRTSTGGELFA